MDVCMCAYGEAIREIGRAKRNAKLNQQGGSRDEIYCERANERDREARTEGWSKQDVNYDRDGKDR